MLGRLSILIKEFKSRWSWSDDADRLGPDMLSTHFKFYFPSLQKRFAKKSLRILVKMQNLEWEHTRYVVPI